MGISIDEKLSLKSIVNFDRYPIDRPEFADNCKKSIDSNGCIVLPNFLSFLDFNTLVIRRFAELPEFVKIPYSFPKWSANSNSTRPRKSKSS